MSRLITATNPETGTVCYGQLSGGSCIKGYDANGNLVAKTDARGIVMSYYYDALNRMTNKQSTGGTNVGIVNFLYTYDSTTTAVTNGIGRLVATANGNGESELYGYDAMGRTTSESVYLPSTPKAAATVSAIYDLAGDMTDLTYPDGRHITQVSDSAGRLSESKLAAINGTAPASPQIYAQSITYLSDGTPAVLTLGDAVVQTATENNRLQLQSLAVSSPTNAHSGQVTYCYYAKCATSGTGNNGNILSIVDGLNAANTQAFTYDSLNRINTFSLGGTLSQQYSIDSFGNLTGVVGGKATMTFAPATNRISNLPCAASVSAFDAAGNQLCSTNSAGAVTQYQFDAEDRASQIAIINTSTPFETYIYAADGARARKSNAGGTYTEYVHFGGMSLAERDQAGVWTDHIYANGKQIASTSNSDVRLHLSGVSPSGAASSNQASGTFTFPYTIQTGDALAFRMYSHNATADLSIYFTDGSTLPSSGSTCGIDQTGQCLSGEKVSNAWVSRIVNLGAIADGKTISTIVLNNGPTAPAGEFDLMIADFVIISANGTVSPLIGDLPSVACTEAGTTGMTSLSCVSERVTSPSDFAGTPETARYFLSDHLGTAQLELTAGGWPVWRGHFSPFGQELDTLATSNNYKFTGKERDAESSLDYFPARYYGSSLGRFASPDIHNAVLIRQNMIAGGLPDEAAQSFLEGYLDNPQNWNQYAYVRNNPLRYKDPNGAAAVEGHHLIPERGSIGSAGTLARDFANKIRTGALSGNGFPNQPGFNQMHRAYNDAVYELLEETEQIHGSCDKWDVNQWKSFANQVLNSDEPAIKDFLDSLEKNNPGSRAALAAAVAAYRVTARLIAQALATVIATDLTSGLTDLIVMIKVPEYKVTSRMIIPPLD
jgi:RHS repeat-associated protein